MISDSDPKALAWLGSLSPQHLKGPQMSPSILFLELYEMGIAMQSCHLP